MCNRPSIPPKSTNAPYSVRFLTIPSTSMPSSNLASSSSRSAEFSASITARRDTTILLRCLSILMTLNSSSLPSRCVVSRTGRTSTNDPGRNARTEPISTVKPPLTLDEITPLTISSFSCSCSSARQLSSRFAFSRESTV